MRLALFVTCLNDTLFPQAGRATVALLEGLGHEVEFPLEQTCCGQLHANAGYGRQALPLVRRFAEAFSDPRFDAVVTPSGSCAAMVRDHYPALARERGDAGLLRAVEALGPRVFELTRFLVDELGVEDVGAAFPARVVLHPACHALRSPHGSADAALRLLRRVRGIELAALPRAHECCGFGGTFAVKRAETSAAMLADKLGALRETGASVVCAVDSSCLLQIGGGLARAGAGMRTMHVAEILACR